MTLDNWLHFVHVLAAMVWVGGGVILLLMGLRARSRSEPAALSEFARSLPYVGLRVLMPAVILVLVTGVWMVFENSQWHFSQFWVLFALALFAIAFLVGGVFLSRIGVELDRLTGSPAFDPAAAAALTARWATGYVVVLAVLLVAVWDMVFKPGT